MDYSRSTNVRLIEDIKADKEDAWDQFCAFYWDPIIGWAKQFGCSKTAAEDVFQETIICLTRQLPNFNYDSRKGHFRGFLKTIVQRRTADHYRKEGKFVRLASIDNNTENAEFSEIDAADKLQMNNNKQDSPVESDLIWMKCLLKKAIKLTAEKLDPETYLSFKLYVLMEMPVEIVLQITGIKRKDTVYQHKRRFLAALKDEFYNLINETCEAFEINNDKFDEQIFPRLMAKVVEGIPDFHTTDFLAKAKEVKLNLVGAPPEKFLDRLKKVTEIIKDMGDKVKTYDNALIVIDKDKKNIYELADATTIGRSEKSDIHLNYNIVSTIHATIQRDEDNNFMLKDMHSRNGTYLNGKKILEPHILISGDIIEITSKATLVFISS